MNKERVVHFGIGLGILIWILGSALAIPTIIVVAIHFVIKYW